jgi:hypothetical protein
MRNQAGAVASQPSILLCAPGPTCQRLLPPFFSSSSFPAWTLLHRNLPRFLGISCLACAIDPLKSLGILPAIFFRI